MKELAVGAVKVCIEPIEACGGEPGPRSGRRQRETAAVGRIAAALGVEIGHAPDGAPTVPNAHISVSHSMGLAVVALCQAAPVGVDAEDWREALWRVRPKFLSASEMEAFSDVESLLWAWTAKEAVYKAAPPPRPQMSEIECSPQKDSAQALGRRYELRSWMEGATRITLAQPHGAD